MFILLIEWAWFDTLILFVIIVNCYVLAVAERPDESIAHLPHEIVVQLEYACTCVFTVELGGRAVAMGIFTDPYHALLSDPWNQ